MDKDNIITEDKIEEWPPVQWMENLKIELNSLFISFGPPNMTVSEVDLLGMKIISELEEIYQNKLSST